MSPALSSWSVGLMLRLCLASLTIFLLVNGLYIFRVGASRKLDKDVADKASRVLLGFDCPTTPACSKELVESVRQAPIKQGSSYLSACIFARNERPYLEEWVLYHYLLGFEHFYVYDNNSTDNMTSSIKHLEDFGLVTLIDWNKTEFVGKSKRVAQRAQMGDCWDRAKQDGSKWVLNFDTDEFVVTFPSDFKDSALHGNSSFYLHSFLKRAEQLHAAVIILDRAEFGSNGHEHFTPGLQIEQYSARQISKWRKPVDAMGKPFLHLPHSKKQDDGHFGDAVDSWFRMDALYTNVTRKDRGPVLEPVRLNHYVSRSYEECIKKLHLSVWRTKAGTSFCDYLYEGSGVFNEAFSIQDTALSQSQFPCLIKSLMQDFGSHSGKSEGDTKIERKRKLI